nr:hypothetical protein [Corynebacterium callunae]
MLPPQVDKATSDEAEIAVANQQAQLQTFATTAASCHRFIFTIYDVCGAILERYNQLGNLLSFLLDPIGPQIQNPDGVGFHQQFRNGFIFWHPDTGAHAIATRNAEVYQRNGWSAGWMGYPLGGEVPVSGSNPIDGELNGWVQLFQGGRIYRSPVLEGFQVASINGLILDKWLALGGIDSGLGLPITNEANTSDSLGRFSRFHHGVIYWHPSHGAHAIVEPILTEWAYTGYEAGEYGYPISDVQTEGEFQTQSFQGGDVRVLSPDSIIPMEVPFIKFDSEEEAWDFFDQEWEMIEKSSRIPDSINSVQTLDISPLWAGKKDDEYGPCLLTVPDPHIRTSWAEQQGIRAIGVKPVTLCSEQPLRITHKTFLVHALGSGVLGWVPGINGIVDIPRRSKQVPQRHRQNYQYSYISKDLSRECTGDGLRNYRATVKATITTDEGTYYAQAFSNFKSEKCHIRIG